MLVHCCLFLDMIPIYLLRFQADPVRFGCPRRALILSATATDRLLIRGSEGYYLHYNVTDYPPI